MTKSWLAAHLFLDPPWSVFLSSFVFPLVTNWKEQRLIDRFFFIRYFEGGPHIRLRVHGDTKTLNQSLRLEMEKQFLEMYGSTAFSNETLSFHLDHLEPKSIQFPPYEPETQRYGGTAGIPVCEELFESSSRCVLQFLKSQQNPTYDNSLAFGLIMHLVFGYALDLTSTKLIDLAQFIKKCWIPRTIQLTQKSAEDTHHESNQELQSQFETAYALQKETLIPLLATIWKQLMTEDPFEVSFLQEWLESGRRFNSKMNLLMDQELILPPPFPAKYTGIPLTDQNRFFPMYESLIHMTNNRLGISNVDEAFIGFILEKFFQNVILNHPAPVM